MTTDIMVGGTGVLTIGATAGNGIQPNTVGCNVVLDSTVHPSITYPNGTYQSWDWQPAPLPYIPNVNNNYFWCNCNGYACWTTHCCKCTAKMLEAIAQTFTPKGLAPVATPNVADTLLTQAKSRITEIQRKLDEVPALEAEIARLRRMVDAAEGK